MCVDCHPPPSPALVGKYLGLFVDEAGATQTLPVDRRGRITLARAGWDVRSDPVRSGADPRADWEWLTVEVLPGVEVSGRRASFVVL